MCFSVAVLYRYPFLLCLLGLAVVGCGRSPAAEQGAVKGVSPALHARSEAARLAALHMDHPAARRLLGGHRYKALHRVRVTLGGQPDRSFEDRYELRCAGKGDCYGRQDNSLEYGVEFYRIGEQTYFRHRYQRFLRFSEEPAEARRRVARIWSAGAAIIELLEGHLKTTPAGEVTVAGRAASRYKLSRGSGAARIYGGRRAWRGRLKALKVEGEAVLDKATGAPLSLRVRYAVSAPKDGRTVTISGEFDGAVSQVGKPQVIKPPTDFAVARTRPRETQELRLLGSHRLNPGWFRGGGPQAARRGASSGAMGRGAQRPRAVMGAMAPRRPAPRSGMVARPTGPRARPGRPVARPRPTDKP